MHSRKRGGYCCECGIQTWLTLQTLIKLFRQGRATSRALFGGDSLNIDISINSWDEEKNPRLSLLQRTLGRRRSSIDKQRMFGHLEDRFTSIALRISTYPVALIIVNGIITIGDLYLSAIGGVHDKPTYILYCIYYFLYGARGIVFVALSLFVDPCLIRGVKAAWRIKHPRREPEGAEFDWLPSEQDGYVQDTSPDIDPLSPAPPEQAHLDDRRSSVESGRSMDVMQALFAAGPPGDQHDAHSGGHHFHRPHMHFPHPHLPHLPWFLKRHIKTHAPKDEEEALPAPEAFPGVAALPEGMDGGADDVVLPEYLEAKAEADQLHRVLVSPTRSPLGSPARDIPSGIAGRAGSIASGRSGSMSNRPSMSSKRPSVSGSAGVPPAPGLRWTPSVRGSMRGSVGRSSYEPRNPLAIVDERRIRRQAAMEIAEKLYEEMEAQL